MERLGEAGARPVALVTGGSRGIGRAVVLALARRGCDVAFSYRSRADQAQAVLAEIREAGARGEALACDVADYELAREVVRQVRSSFGKIDFLVNNAGLVRDRLLMAMKAEEWEEVVATNLTGTFNFCRAVVVDMMKRRQGRILNIASVSGLTGVPGQVNYSAAKAGVIGFTKALAREVAPLNVAVNTLALGFVETDLTAQLATAYREQLLNLIPVRRFGTPEEVAEVACFFLLAAPLYVTGAVLRVDGGMAA